MSSSVIPLIALAVAVLVLHRMLRHAASKKTETPATQGLKALAQHHETAAALLQLVDTDGAGSWPPRTTHGSNWPVALQPYHEIYLELLPLLSSTEPSLDDEVNNKKRSGYREIMRKLFADRINLAKVEGILAQAAAGNWDICSRHAYNGFYSCIGVSRHAYRWATIPIVKVAQDEKLVDFPAELDVPWSHLQRHFGLAADSGNNTSNVLLNYNENGERAYRINLDISDLVTSTEEAFFRLFWDVEVLGAPIYIEMIRANIAYDQNDKAACLKHMDNIADQLRGLLRVWYQSMTQVRVNKSVWLSYCQGFQGWGCGRMVDGEMVIFDGVSGSHTMFFMALDAFLGMDPYLSQENAARCIPHNQRELCATLRNHSFIKRLQAKGDRELVKASQKIVNHLKMWRSAHKTRVMPYLAQPAPERTMMTAGKSFIESGSDMAHLKILEGMLMGRLKKTVALSSKLLGIYGNNNSESPTTPTDGPLENKMPIPTVT
ncbi:hypothetical protein BFJ69_g3281 [Fusarium oxysporum]|uniref:Indoleamine 2,3-dioxygenase n=1 Tax=Fusarium oxysporum TaxID=5507 RepID=A0A420NQ38_FUSOX|nr:hypothetical protein BFJ69_g3281 [Fusarium oxysporum]